MPLILALGSPHTDLKSTPRMASFAISQISHVNEKALLSLFSLDSKPSCAANRALVSPTSVSHT